MQGENKPIRVAHVIGSVCRGGVESVVFNYYRAIDKSHMQFDFIIDDDSPCEIPNDIIELGCRVYKIPSYRHLSAYIRELKKIFADYQIVHSHMNTLSVFTLYAAKCAGAPVRIAHNHSTAGRGKGEFFRNLMKYTLRPFAKLYPTHLFACSEHAGRWLFGNKAFDAERVTVIPNAIDVSKFRFNPETRERVRKDLGIDDKFVIGHVGRFIPQKNHRFLVSVFAEIHKQKQDAVLMLIGDGELKPDIEQMIDWLGLQQAVVFLGNRNDVHELYQAMDVFVLPSLYEGLPVTAVEAQCAGLPCVLSERVTGEVAIGHMTQFLSLKTGIAQWSQTVIRQQQQNDREEESAFCCAKWDIAKHAELLTTLYEAAGMCPERQW